MLESEVDHLAQTEALLYLIGSRSIGHIRSVVTAATLQCETLMFEWLDATWTSPTRQQADVFPIVVALRLEESRSVPFNKVAMGASVVGLLREWFDPVTIRNECQQALEQEHPPAMPELPSVVPLTSTRIEYGLDAANDQNITPQLRARIVARSFGLRPWSPVTLPDRAYYQEFLDWVNDGSAVRRAIEDVARGSITSMPEAIVATMVDGLQHSELIALMEVDDRILQAFAQAASDPESLTLTIRKGMAKMLHYSTGCSLATARMLIDTWANGQPVDPGIARMCSQYREALEIAQTYRTIAA